MTQPCRSDRPHRSGCRICASTPAARCRPSAPRRRATSAGVVRSSQGPEAGVWVIAETKDLPTNFIKIVVTDDQGRFMVPELPAANYSVLVRGYGLVDSTPIQIETRHDCTSTLTATLGQDAAGSGEGLSGQLLAVAARAAGGERVPRHRTAGQRPRAEHADAEPLDQLAEVGLQLLSSARQPAHAQRRSRVQGEAGAEDARRGVGVAARHGRSRHVDVRRADQPGQGTIAQGLRRLDRARSPRAKCRRRRRGRKASSAISS